MSTSNITSMTDRCTGKKRNVYGASNLDPMTHKSSVYGVRNHDPITLERAHRMGLEVVIP